jgi:hypothetical protein
VCSKRTAGISRNGTVGRCIVSVPNLNTGVLAGESLWGIISPPPFCPFFFAAVNSFYIHEACENSLSRRIVYTYDYNINVFVAREKNVKNNLPMNDSDNSLIFYQPPIPTSQTLKMLENDTDCWKGHRPVDLSRNIGNIYNIYMKFWHWFCKPIKRPLVSVRNATNRVHPCVNFPLRDRTSIPLAQKYTTKMKRLTVYADDHRLVYLPWLKATRSRRYGNVPAVVYWLWLRITDARIFDIGGK